MTLPINIPTCTICMKNKVENAVNNVVARGIVNEIPPAKIENKVRMIRNLTHTFRNQIQFERDLLDAIEMSELSR